MLYHTQLTLAYNTHAVVEAVLDDPARPLLLDVRSVGCGVYPSLCLLNTACDQNTAKYNLGSRVVAIASKLIRPGEEVTDNYYPAAAFLGRTERRAWLQEHYRFHCECVACRSDLPLLSALPATPQLLVCGECGAGGLTAAGRCGHCGQVGDWQAGLQRVQTAREKILQLVALYQANTAACPVMLCKNLQTEYTELRKTVVHPFRFLVVAEQQFLKSVKQSRGNRVFKKSS